jgi:RNA polymerase sigma factor (sigma-70 family)
VNITPDAELITRLRNGEISAGGDLYERYKWNIYYFILHMVTDQALAEDITQHTFIVMIEKIKTLRKDITFKHWLFTIACNESLMQLRRKNLLQMDGLDVAEETIHTSETPESVYAKMEAIEIVHRAVDQLVPQYRELILLRMIEHLTYDEIADSNAK